MHGKYRTALSVLTLLPPQASMCHNFNKTARQDIPISTWQDIPLAACHYIPISAWQYISIFQHNIYLIRKAVGASNIFPSTTWIRWALHTAVWNHNDVDHHHHYHLFRQLTLMFWSNSFWSSSSFWSPPPFSLKAETLVSKESTSVCMEEHVDVEHLSSNTDGNADEELYVVVQEDACQGVYFEEGEIMATCLVFVRFLVL